MLKRPLREYPVWLSALWVIGYAITLSAVQYVLVIPIDALFGRASIAVWLIAVLGVLLLTARFGHKEGNKIIEWSMISMAVLVLVGSACTALVVWTQ